MKGKSLYPLNDDCSLLQKMCHRTINRILELIVKHPEHSKILSEYVKMCIVMEKLCDCISCNCCNDDSVSKNLIRELSDKCLDLKHTVLKLHKELPKEKSEYIRCKMIADLCDKRIISSKSTKRKSTKKSKKSKK